MLKLSFSHQVKEEVVSQVSRIVERLGLGILVMEMEMELKQWIMNGKETGNYTQAGESHWLVAFFADITPTRVRLSLPHQPYALLTERLDGSWEHCLGNSFLANCSPSGSL